MKDSRLFRVPLTTMRTMKMPEHGADDKEAGGYLVKCGTVWV